MKTGKIYKIVCSTTGEVYIGSTTYRWLCQRIGNHVQCYKAYKKGLFHYCKSFDIIERNNFKHEVIEEISFNEKIELREREQYWIDNTECINEKPAYNPNRQEYLQKYRDKHKEYSKSRANEKIKCVCGCKVSRSNITYHQKTKKHLKLLTSYPNTTNS